MLSIIFGRAPSLPASELPVPSRSSATFPSEIALRRSQNELERLARLFPEGASLWPLSENANED
jgi:hypothetical protein